MEWRSEIESFGHLGVIGVTNYIKRVHGKNFSRAAYLALRAPSHEVQVLGKTDFLKSLSVCMSKRVGEFYVLREAHAVDRISTGARISDLISKNFSPVRVGCIQVDKSIPDNSLDQLECPAENLEGTEIYSTERIDYTQDLNKTYFFLQRR